MRKYMVTVSLPEELDDNFWTLIPKHRELISELMEKEIIISYAINSSRTVGWITMNGENMKQVRDVLKSFPIYSYYLNVDIDELFLFDLSSSGLPKLIMN